MDRTIKIIRSNKINEINGAEPGSVVFAGSNTGNITKVSNYPTQKLSQKMTDEDIQAQKAINDAAAASGRIKRVFEVISEIGQFLGKVGIFASVTGIGALVGAPVTVIGQTAVSVASIAQAIICWEQGDKLSSALYLIKALPGAGLLSGWKVIGPKVRWKIAGNLIRNKRVKSFSAQILNQFANLFQNKPILKDICKLSSALLEGNVNKIAQLLGTTVQDVQTQIAAASPQTTPAPPPAAAPAALQENRKIQKARRTKKLRDLYE